MKTTAKLAKNHGGPLHYLGNRYLSLPDRTGHMFPDTTWLDEHFEIIMGHRLGKKYKRAIEPFAGSASWSLAAMEIGLAEEYIINDSNHILMNALKLMRDKPFLIKQSYIALTQQYVISE